MNIGIFGGTFNPPHKGHLIVAEAVKNEIGLDKILFIPSYISPHKQQGEESISNHRLEMIKIAVSGKPNYSVLDYEINQQGTSYTITTLEFLRQGNPNDRFFVIVGIDNYLTFHEWKDPQKILQIATLVVMNRPNFPKRINESVGTKNVVFVNVPNIDISSSEIRIKVKEGRQIQDDVGGKIEEYIKKHSLYK
jgi:nicotinate-nucleotide adenylyltransferase